MKIELTKEELEKLYEPPPNHPETETDFQRAYRMGRNALVLELQEKIIDKVITDRGNKMKQQIMGEIK